MGPPWCSWRLSWAWQDWLPPSFCWYRSPSRTTGAPGDVAYAPPATESLCTPWVILYGGQPKRPFSPADERFFGPKFTATVRQHRRRLCERAANRRGVVATAVVALGVGVASLVALPGTLALARRPARRRTRSARYRWLMLQGLSAPCHRRDRDLTWDALTVADRLTRTYNTTLTIRASRREIALAVERDRRLGGRGRLATCSNRSAVGGCLGERGQRFSLSRTPPRRLALSSEAAPTSQTTDHPERADLRGAGGVPGSSRRTDSDIGHR